MTTSPQPAVLLAPWREGTSLPVAAASDPRITGGPHWPGQKDHTQMEQGLRHTTGRQRGGGKVRKKGMSEEALGGGCEGWLTGNCRACWGLTLDTRVCDQPQLSFSKCRHEGALPPPWCSQKPPLDTDEGRAVGPSGDGHSAIGAERREAV